MRTPSALPGPDLQRLFDLFEARRFDAMERLAQDLLRAQPEAGMAWKALGIALQAQGGDAVAALQRATELLPQDVELRASLVESHLRQGHARMKSSQPEAALTSYRAAQRLDDRHAHAHACAGVALRELERHEAAVRSLRRALSLRADLLDARFCLGSSLLALGRADEALPCFREVLAAKPDHAAALANLGSTLKTLGRIDEAMPAYRRAVELGPEVALHHANLGAACRDLGQMDEALHHYQRVFDGDARRLDALSDRLLIQNYLTTATPADRLAEARRFGTLAEARARPYTRWKPPASHGDRPLRIGFVSADLREHPVGYFTESLFAALSARHGEHLELFVYDDADAGDALTARLQGHCRYWTRIVRLDDEAAAAAIHEDGLDVLIDLAGHTAGNRLPLFAWRPAPVQIAWLGYCATTGLAAIDGVLTDPWIAPPEADREFVEPLHRLPETFLCFTPPVQDLPVDPLPARQRGRLTFGCFNKFNKLNDAVVAAWARVLLGVPGSVLFLKSGPLGVAAIRRETIDRFLRHGVPPERLEFEGTTRREDYFRAYARVDIALDPFPYPGGTTTLEGLWMGVPVLTLAGSTALARQGESILRNLGLPDWIATDVDDYVARATRLAGDVDALAVLREGLRARLTASPLCDADRYAGHFVDAMRALSAQRPTDDPSTSAADTAGT